MGIPELMNAYFMHEEGDISDAQLARVLAANTQEDVMEAADRIG